jgi:hypothetical protein
MKLVSLICASSLALCAQTLKVSSGSAPPGNGMTVVISFDSAKRSDILGVQWETTFPAQQMSIEGSGPTASDTVKAEGKSLTCAEKAAKELHSYTCILIGGQRQIESGPIAVFTFHISSKAKPGTAPVRVGHAMAVTKDLRKLSLPDVEGTVTVKQ